MYKVLINGFLFGEYTTLSEATRVVYILVDLEPSVQNSIDIEDAGGCIIHYNRVSNELIVERASMIRKCGCWVDRYCIHPDEPEPEFNSDEDLKLQFKSDWEAASVEAE